MAFRAGNFGVRGAELAERVRAALAAISLAEHAERSPAHPSRWDKRRRAALATVLACRPDVLVLDEPSANLDPVACRELAETWVPRHKRHVDRHHDPPYAAQLCDRAVVMDAGLIVADGDIGVPPMRNCWPTSARGALGFDIRPRR